MSRTKKGAKGPGYEYWSRRPAKGCAIQARRTRPSPIGWSGPSPSGNSRRRDDLAGKGMERSTPEQQAAVAVEHNTWNRIVALKKQAQSLLRRVEKISGRLQFDSTLASSEVRETLERRGWQIVARIRAVGDEYLRERDFFRYVDDYCADQGVWNKGIWDEL